jgi:hypothetical protein
LRSNRLKDVGWVLRGKRWELGRIDGTEGSRSRRKETEWIFKGFKVNSRN